MGKLQRTEVVVAGAGPVGLLTAAALAEQGVEVAVVDEVDRSAVHGYALALHPRSLELLDELGMADELVARGRSIKTIALYDGSQRKAEIDLAGIDSAFPFVLSLSQPELEERLRDALRGRGVKVLWNHRLAAFRHGSESGPGDEPGARLAVDRLEGTSAGYPVAAVHQTVAARTEVETEYLVAADGHRSTARRLLRLGFDPVGGPRAFAVFELEADLETALGEGSEMRIVLGESGSAALWPLPGERLRLAFEIDEIPAARPDERRQVQEIGGAAYPEVAREQLQQLVDSRMPWLNGLSSKVLWSIAIRFDPRLVTSLGSDRAWLAGDAAHVTLPLGMQGMNLGLAEGVQLAQAIATALPGGSGRDLFSAYASERYVEARSLMRPGEAFEPGASADAWIAERLERLIPCLPISGDHMSAALDQLGVVSKA